MGAAHEALAQSSGTTSVTTYGSTSGPAAPEMNYSSKLTSAMSSCCFGDADSDPEDRMAARSISWPSAAWVINASVIGMGVLTIPSCFATLGWLFGMVGLVVCLLANILVARVMLDVQELHPGAITLADAAQIASGGSRHVKIIFRSVLYAEKLACTSAFVNLMADTLGSAFHSVHWCEVVWCGVIIVIFLPLTQLKNLSETFYLNAVNFLTILAVVALTCIAIGTTPRTEPVHTSLLPVASSFQSAFGAISMMVFAYSGNWMYFELMSEMKQPKEFLKAFTIAGPTQIGLYALMGAVGYGFLGGSVPASAVEALHFGPLMQVASVLLTLHIVCGTGTNLVVMIRFFHSRISPKDVNEDTARAKIVRTVIYLVIICGTMVVSLSVRGFGAILTLIGALFEAPINFVCPFVIYAGIMRGRPPRRTWYSWLVWVGGFLIASFGLVTMVMGVMSAAKELRPWSSSGGGLFWCNCQGIWDTCDCSPTRMPPGSCPAGAPVQKLVPRPFTMQGWSAPEAAQGQLEPHQQPWLPLYPHGLDHH